MQRCAGDMPCSNSLLCHTSTPRANTSIKPRCTSAAAAEVKSKSVGAAAEEKQERQRQRIAQQAQPPCLTCPAPAAARTRDVVGGQQLAIGVPAALLGAHWFHVHRHRWHHREEAVLARRQAWVHNKSRQWGQ